MSVDYNRPCTKRTSPAGISVIEFADSPGVYVDVNGNPIDEDTASSAGFDVRAGAMERRRRELRAEAERRIEKQLRKEAGEVDAQVEREFDEGAPGSPTPEEEEAFGGGSRRGNGVDGPRLERDGRWWSVYDAEGALVEGDLTKRAAEKLLEQLTGG